MAQLQEDVADAARVVASGLTDPKLVVRENKSGPAWDASWRDSTGKPVLRRVGPAWLCERPPLANPFAENTEGRRADQEPRQEAWRASWQPRKGRPAGGAYKPDQAIKRAHELVVAREVEILEAQRTEALGGSEPTIADAAARWLDHRERVKGLRGSTMAGYRSAVNVHIQPSPFFAKPLREITTADVMAWRDELDGRRDEDGERMLSRRSINKMRMNLHGIFVLASRPIDQGGMGLLTNPVHHCEPLGEEDPEEREPLDPAEVMAVSRAMARGDHRSEPRVAVGPRAKGRKTITREPSAEELEELRRQDEQDAVAVLLLGFCGMRLGELAALRVRRVDFSGGQVKIARSFSPANGKETDTKGKENRWTLLPDQVARPLAKLLTRAHFVGDDDLVICNAVGEHIDVSAFRRRFKKAVKAAGIKRHVRLHDLRHGATTDLRSVFTADHVQKLVGHKDARTAQRYAHARDQADASERWTAYLAEQIEATS